MIRFFKLSPLRLSFYHLGRRHSALRTVYTWMAYSMNRVDCCWINNFRLTKSNEYIKIIDGQEKRKKNDWKKKSKHEIENSIGRNEIKWTINGLPIINSWKLWCDKDKNWFKFYSFMLHLKLAHKTNIVSTQKNSNSSNNNTKPQSNKN